MAIEKERGCGYRRVGGMYLVGTGLAVPCDRLPFNLEVCPTCSQGIKFSRGFTWVSGELLGEHKDCTDEFKTMCPVCSPLGKSKLGLMGVGSRFYTPESFIKESHEMGVSKRIISFPKGLKLGETWVLLVHPKAGTKQVPSDQTVLNVESESRFTNVTAEEVASASIQPTLKEVKVPAIFYAFRPQRVEMLIKASSATTERLESLRKRSITPIVVPDDDKDHMGSVWDRTVHVYKCVGLSNCGQFESKRKRVRCIYCKCKVEQVSERKEPRSGSE